MLCALEALAAKKVDDLKKREADDVCVRSNECTDEPRRHPLNGVSAGLAVPLAGREILLDLGSVEAPEHDGGLDPARDKATIGYECDAAVNPVTTPRKQLQAFPRCLLMNGLRQNPASASYDCIGGQHEGGGMARRHSPRLRGRKSQRMPRGKLSLKRRLINPSRVNHIRSEADLGQESDPPGRRRGQHEALVGHMVRAHG